MVGDVETHTVVRGQARAADRARRSMPSWRTRALLACALTLVAVGFAGCGSALEDDPAAHVMATLEPLPINVPASCSSAALETLSSVLQRVYHEGVLSERTASAQYLIDSSAALRAAVESDSKQATRVAVAALLATGHITNVTITRGARTLASAGGPALAPLRGTIKGTGGEPIGSYVASVWADEGFLTESDGITQGLVALRVDGQSVGGSPSLPSGLGSEGKFTLAGVAYRYTSFEATAYPSGSVRIYLLVPARTIAPLCGSTRQDTMVKTLKRVAKLIYTGESGLSAQKEVRRVQRNKPLLEAVAHRDPEATRLAIDALLNQHIVRMRITVGGQLLADVGGPYVLAPVTAPLRLHGHTIGSLVLSIQDDEGYLRLARRLAGLAVLMYMQPEVAGEAPVLVKNSLGSSPGPPLESVPAGGTFDYEGRSYRVFTVHASAFPSGSLTIRVLVPIPYTFFASEKTSSETGSG
jgi:hypothetical protein